MGLDVTLGVIILVAAFRGWFQGFITQAVRIAGLVACVYLAEPVRDYAKPYVLPYLPAIQPALVDRLLWWVSAAVTYVVLVGVATLIIKMTRRPEIPGIPQAGRNDQFAGFMLGASKGVLIAAFATAAIQKYGMEPIKTVPWAEEQVKTSWAAKWNEDYHPVPQDLVVAARPPPRQLRRAHGTAASPASRRSRRTAKKTMRRPRPFAPPADPPTRMSRATLVTSGEPPKPAERLDPDDQAIADLKAELKKAAQGIELTGESEPHERADWVSDLRNRPARFGRPVRKTSKSGRRPSGLTAINCIAARERHHGWRQGKPERRN